MHGAILNVEGCRKGILYHEVMEKFLPRVWARFGHERTRNGRKTRGRTNVSEDTRVGWLRVCPRNNEMILVRPCKGSLLGGRE